MDSTGQTIDFLLTAKQDAASGKRFLRKALQSLGNLVPRVVHVDKNPAYLAAVADLQGRRDITSPCPPTSVQVPQQQDHRTVKKRVRLAKGYGSFQSAWRTLQGIEAMHMINKGRVRWLPKGDAAGQANLVAELFGIAA
jgi:transposase-like protein